MPHQPEELLLRADILGAEVTIKDNQIQGFSIPAKELGFLKMDVISVETWTMAGRTLPAHMQARS